MNSLDKISIIGTGNVGTHLYNAFTSLAPALDVKLVNPRTLEGLTKDNDVILIAVKDDAIPEVASRVAGHGAIIAHTSGSVPMEILKNSARHYGVFYPLQTFTKNKELNYKEIPFFIEGSSRETSAELSELAGWISPHVYEADSPKRKRLHIAAVFACNFSNHLVSIADDILHENGMDYTVLLPLLNETVGKLQSLSPAKAQTGPAVRHDHTVMEAHEKMLERQPDKLAIYRLLSDSIMNKNTKE